MKTDSRTYDPDLQNLLIKESQVPWNHIITLSLLFAVILTINLLKGGGGFSPLGIRCGSQGFWISNLMMALSIIIFTHGVRLYLNGQHTLKSRMNYPYATGDIKVRGSVERSDELTATMLTTRTAQAYSSVQNALPYQSPQLFLT